MKLAKEQGKPLLLAFHAEWCPPCKKMKKETYRDSGVIRLSQKFVAVMVDVDEQKALAGQYAKQGIPAYTILRPDGTVADSFLGFRKPEAFSVKLKSALGKI